MFHPDVPALAGGKERGVQRDVANVTAANLQSGQCRQIQGRKRCLRRKHFLPDQAAVLTIGKRELYEESETAQERPVESGSPVSTQNRQPPVVFHALQQVVDL